MREVKVSVIGWDGSVSDLFRSRGFTVSTLHSAEQEASPDFIVFTGGADIQPHLYGEENLGESHCNPRRDTEEIAIYEKFKDVKKIGICRGMQLLNVLNGGKMVQHITGHVGGKHPIIDHRTGRSLKNNSCHHQMCVLPEGSNSIELISSSTDKYAVPEGIFIHSDKALGIQGHPEWENETADYFFSLLARYF